MSTQCTFPVCPSSPSECILEAFMQSGYYYQLNQQQRQAAQSNPSGWLQGHPYLYGAYPYYFSQTCLPMNPGPGSPWWSQYIQQQEETYNNQTYTGSTPPSPPPNNPSSGGSYSWMTPFEEFGGFLLKVGAGINDFIQTVGSTYSEMVSTTGRYPWGAIILFVFIFIVAIAIGWIL